MMYDQHSNEPTHLEKVSLGCLEINYSDLKYSDHLFLLHLYIFFSISLIFISKLIFF